MKITILLILLVTSTHLAYASGERSHVCTSVGLPWCVDISVKGEVQCTDMHLTPKLKITMRCKPISEHYLSLNNNYVKYEFIFSPSEFTCKPASSGDKCFHPRGLQMTVTASFRDDIKPPYQKVWFIKKGIAYTAMHLELTPK